MKLFLIIFLMLTSFAVDARPSVLEQLGFNSSNEPLPVDKAFAFSADQRDPQTLLLSWRVADGNYLYRDKFEFEIVDNPAVTVGEARLPEGENKRDEYFGLTEVYPFDVQVDLPLNRPAAAQNFTLQVRYQGCSETFNICYPPETKTVQFDLTALTEITPGAFAAADTSVAAVSGMPVSDQDRFARTLAEDNLGKILLGFLGLGLLLAFTPCVFPMIPILSSIIVGEGEDVTTRRAFLLSLVYVLAMSATYTTAGVLTGMLGGNLQAMLQNIWVIGVFSILLVLLALSMFGFYQLQLPHSFQNRLHAYSQKHPGGKFYSVAIMGLLSGLIVGPCLAPPLAGALLFISQQADPFIGGAALFAMSIGMGIPLLIIGTSAGSLLPRAGAWMEVIKAVFGVMLLALAIWMLDRVLPDWITLLLSGSLLIVCAIYMNALESLGVSATGWQKLWKGTGLLLLIAGFLVLIGAASGGQSVWQPLKHLTITNATTTQQAPALNFIRVNSMAEIEDHLAQTNRPVMLDFYADWCTDCKTMEQTTFKDPQVVAFLDDYTLLKLDMTDNTPAHQAVLRNLQVFGPPTMIFFTDQGEEVSGSRLIGHISASGMQAHLSQLNLHNP